MFVDWVRNISICRFYSDIFVLYMKDLGQNSPFFLELLLLSVCYLWFGGVSAFQTFSRFIHMRKFQRG